MFEGKTSTEFKFKIDDNITDDWELVELYAEAEHGDSLASIKVLSQILGADQYNALKEHCRGKSGRVSAEQMESEMKEIMSSSNATKN